MIEATVDLRDVDRGFAGLLRAGRDAAPYFRALVPEVRRDQRDHARQQEAPDGAWASWSPAYERKKERRRGTRRGRGRKMLGRLPRAVRYRAGGDYVEAESRVRWSGVHQEGGRVGRGADVPARPFLWFSDDFLDDATEAMSDYAARGWSR